jgi:hypothetical protein
MHRVRAYPTLPHHIVHFGGAGDVSDRRFRQGWHLECVLCRKCIRGVRMSERETYGGGILKSGYAERGEGIKVACDGEFVNRNLRVGSRPAIRLAPLWSALDGVWNGERRVGIVDCAVMEPPSPYNMGG